MAARGQSTSRACFLRLPARSISVSVGNRREPAWLARFPQRALLTEE